MPKYLPFDYSVFDNEHMNRMGAFTMGLLHLIVAEYWRTGVDITLDDYRTAMMVKTDIRTWKKKKTEVLEAFRYIFQDIKKKGEMLKQLGHLVARPLAKLWQAIKNI